MAVTMIGLAVAALAVSAIGGAYGAYTANEAAEEQRDQLTIQREQAAEASAIQQEQASAQTEAQVEQQKMAAVQYSAEQASAGAASGLQLSPGTSYGLIQEQTKQRFDEAITKTMTAGQQTQSNIEKQLDWTLQGLDFQANQIPVTGELATKGALSFGATALSAYAGAKSAQSQQDLLSKQYGGGITADNFSVTAASTQTKAATGYSLL